MDAADAAKNASWPTSRCGPSAPAAPPPPSRPRRSAPPSAPPCRGMFGAEVAADAMRILYGGSHERGERGAAAGRSPTSTAASSAARRLKADSFIQIVKKPAKWNDLLWRRPAKSCAFPPVSSSWTASALAEPGPGNAISLAATPGARPPVRRGCPPRAIGGLRRGRGPARGADGQLGGGAY